MATGFTYEWVEKYVVKAELTQPMHIGAESTAESDTRTGVLVHPVTGRPFVQASSLAGVFRAYYNSRNGEEATDELFGKSKRGKNEAVSDCQSRVFFTDGQFTSQNKLKLEYRPRVCIDDEKGTASTGKFEMEYVGVGANLDFTLYVYGDSRCEKNCLDDIFSAMNAGDVQIGGQKSNGCGYLKVDKLYYKDFNLKTSEGRKDWIKDEPEKIDGLEQITVKDQKGTSRAYRVIVTGKTEGSVLVKGISVAGVGKDAPDAENMRNVKGDYIIPASSAKGTIRNQMERIAKIVSSDDEKAAKVIEEAFGKVGVSKDTGKCGNLRFYDAIIGEKEENEKAPLQHRIKIDKFTGGVMQSGLFSERDAAGNMAIQVDITEQTSPKAVCGLLLLALRDVAGGLVNFGSGYSIGKGFMNVDKITIISKDKKECTITYSDVNGNVEDPNDIIGECLRALKEEVQ